MNVPLALQALTIFSPISTEAAMGFSVKSGMRALNSSGTSVPCRVNGCAATMPSRRSAASISSWVR